jgi:hypothetical protein
MVGDASDVVGVGDAPHNRLHLLGNVRAQRRFELCDERGALDLHDFLLLPLELDGFQARQLEAKHRSRAQRTCDATQTMQPRKFTSRRATNRSAHSLTPGFLTQQKDGSARGVQIAEPFERVHFEALKDGVSEWIRMHHL